jgi:probable HAF family extracellular repeat protein
MMRSFDFAEALESRRLLAAYALVDLGTLGGAGAEAFDINDQNQVVGFAQNASGQDRAFVFADADGDHVADAGEMVDLGVLAGDTASYAYGINNNGVIVGTSRTTPLPGDGDERAVRFNVGAAPTNLGVGTGSNGYGASASDLNDAGQIVGGRLSGFNYVPFVRSTSGVVTTFTLPAPYNLYGEARAINSAGAAVGYSGSPAGDSGFIRAADGTMTAVGHDSPALPYSYAWDLNDVGQVVGEGFNAAGDYRAFVWKDGTATDLGTLPGFGSSEAYGINNLGDVVGRVEPPDFPKGSTHAFVYANGVMRDLNSLIAAGSGYVVTEARAINGGGAIAAVATSAAGITRAVLLVPNAPVAGQYVFYNNSAFDGRDPAASAADDAAIAPDKRARAAGAPASFDNVTSYSRGINGVMVDMNTLGGTLSADDFEFRVGNGGSPDTWAAAPAPTGITVRPGAGASGSDRVTITWADGAVRNQWLQVTIRPTAATGLRAPVVFSFGNLVGDTGGEAAGAAFRVDSLDVFATRAAMPATAATLTDRHDFNRDGRVNVIDLLIARRSAGATLDAGVPTVTRARLLRAARLQDLLR